MDISNLFQQLPFSKFDENVVLNMKMEILGIYVDGRILNQSIK
jgi:hypothetical protein